MDKHCMIIGWLVGRGIAGQRKRAEKAPVAYLYNGVRLPKLPEVDGYDNALIVDADGVYLANLTKGKLEAYNTGRVALSVTEIYQYADGQWVSAYWTKFPSTYPLVWTNYDLYYKTVDSYGELSGTLCMAASEPVPVYE